MFRISAIVGKVVTTFHEAETAIEDAATKIYNVLPSPFQAMIRQDVQLAKQFASDAITRADTALAAHQQAIASGVEKLADTELAVLTEGKSVPLNAFTNAGIDQLVANGVAAFHNWGLSAKAELATVPADAAAPAFQQPVSNGGGQPD